MSSTTSISVSEYLATFYRPDRDYVDGEVRERNWGEWDHSRLQARLAAYFLTQEQSSGLLVATEQRVQVRTARFRIPDISLVHGDPGEQVLTRPPFICIEILSPEDSLSSIRDRIEDYQAFGVNHIWIVDPQHKRSYWVDSTGTHLAADAILESRNPSARLDLKSAKVTAARR